MMQAQPRINAAKVPTVRSLGPFVLFALLLPASALAHPDHGSGGLWPGFVHPYRGLDHLLAAVAVGVWSARTGGRATWAAPLAFLAAMATGGAMSVAGLALPGTELLIAASVLVLGALIACDTRVGLPVAAALAATAAWFHGAAHGVEAPAMASMYPYCGGLLLGTALLHATGVGAALAVRARPVWARMAGVPIALSGLVMLAVRVS